MSAEIGVAASFGKNFLIAEFLEEFCDTACVPPQLFKVANGFAVRHSFFGARVHEEVERSELLGTCDQGGTSISCARSDGEDTEANGDQGRA